MKIFTAKEAKKIAKEHANKVKNKNRLSDFSVDLELIWISDFIKRTAEKGGRCCVIDCGKIDMGKEVAIKKALTKKTISCELLWRRIVNLLVNKNIVLWEVCMKRNEVIYTLEASLGDHDFLEDKSAGVFIVQAIRWSIAALKELCDDEDWSKLEQEIDNG